MKIMANDKAYEIGELSLGEFRLLKQSFGLLRMDLLDPRDPEHLVGMLVCAELRANPGRPLEDVLAEVDGVTKIEVELDEDESDPEDPTSEGSPASQAESSRGDVAASSAG